MDSTHEHGKKCPGIGNRYANVADMMKGLGVPQEVQQAVQDMESETRVVTQLIMLRHKCGVTQEQVAKELGVKQAAISKLESGTDDDLKLGEISAYARATGQRVGVLYGRELSHIEAINMHALGLKNHLRALANLANKNKDMEEKVESVFGAAFFKLMNILVECNGALPQKSAAKLSLKLVVTDADGAPVGIENEDDGRLLVEANA